MFSVKWRGFNRNQDLQISWVRKLSWHLSRSSDYNYMETLCWFSMEPNLWEWQFVEWVMTYWFQLSTLSPLTCLPVTEDAQKEARGGISTGMSLTNEFIEKTLSFDPWSGITRAASINIPIIDISALIMTSDMSILSTLHFLLMNPQIQQKGPGMHTLNGLVVVVMLLTHFHHCPFVWELTR